MYDPVPREPGIVDNDMYLSLPELCRLLNKFIDVLGIQHVAWYSSGFSTHLVDFFSYRFRFA